MKTTIIYKHENIGKIKISTDQIVVSKILKYKNQFYFIESVEKTSTSHTVYVLDLEELFVEIKKEYIIKLIDGDRISLYELERIHKELNK